MKNKARKIYLLLFFALGFSLANAQSADSNHLPLTVTANTNKALLNNLSAQNFEIYFGNNRAEIESFAQKDELLSVGVLIDTSASMRDEREASRRRVKFGAASFSKFLENANPANDYFVMNFDKSVNVVLDTTQDQEKVKKAIAEVSENRMTANKTEFYNAVKIAYEKIGKSKNAKKVLVLITDAQDNGSSKLDFGDIKNLLKRESVLLYAIRILPDESLRFSIETLMSLQNVSLFERDWRKIRLIAEPFPAKENLPSRDLIKDLDELVSITGGRVFFPITQKEIDNSFGLLADELKNQYAVIIKPPANFSKNGFSEIKIKFIEQKDKKVGKVTVRTRKGFYL